MHHNCLKNKVTVPRRPEMTLKDITSKYAIAVIASGFRICQQVVLVSWLTPTETT